MGKQNLVLTIQRRLLWELIKSASKVFLAPSGDRLQQVKDIPCLPLIYDIFIVWVLFRGKRTDVYIHFCFVPSLSLQEIVILCSDLIDTQNTHTCRINMFERGSTISSLGMLGLNVDVQTRRSNSLTSCTDSCDPFRLQSIVALNGNHLVLEILIFFTATVIKVSHSQ